MPVLRNTSQKSSQRPRRRRSVRKTRRSSALTLLRPLVILLLGVAVVAGALYVFWPDSVDGADSTPEEIEAAAYAGARAGAAVSSTVDGTMAREGAILEIRARETAIRRAGFTMAADTFAASAQAAMERAGVF